MLSETKPLSELAARVESLPQRLINIKVKQRLPLESIPAVKTALNRIQKTLNNKGRAVLRYSGTEPIARIMVEGTDIKLVDCLAADLAEVIQSHIGV
jgi:phosphoglucosamine mutase